MLKGTLPSATVDNDRQHKAAGFGETVCRPGQVVGKWLKAQTIAQLIDRHRDSVTRRGNPWPLGFVRGRFRFKYLKLGEFSDPKPRYFWPDVQAFLGLRAEAYLVGVDDVEPAGIRIATAAELLDIERSTIERRVIPWQTDHVPYQVRCLPESKPKQRWCHVPDVLALLVDPRQASEAPEQFLPGATGTKGDTP